MLISEIAENNKIEAEMKLRKMAREMRAGKLGFPKIFGYLNQHKLALNLVLPTKGKWIRGTHPPRRIINDIKIYMHAGASAPFTYVFFYQLTVPNIPTADKTEKVKRAVVAFTRHFFAEEFNYIGEGFPIDIYSVTHAGDYETYDVDYEGFSRHANQIYRPYHKLITELYYANLINQFANMVRTLQNVN